MAEMNLVEFRWRDVAFPTTDFRVDMRQNLAVHEFVGRDGADVEATGRAPLKFSARIPFLNGIEPAPYETWKKGTLYRAQCFRFLKAMADSTKGTLQHPALGNVLCRPEHAQIDYTATTRDGVFVDAEWIETFDDASKLTDVIGAISPEAQALEAARDLDAGLSQITPPIPTLPRYPESFEESMRQVSGVFDQVTILSRAYAGVVDTISYRVNAIADALDQAARAPGAAVQHVIDWPIRDALERMKAALYSVREGLLKRARPIGLIYPGVDTSLPMLSIDLSADLGDLMTLNPTLLASAYVPAGSRVRYYLP